MILSKEPVAIVNAVRLVVLALVAFGLSLTEVQIVATMTALEAILTLFTRSKVTPVPSEGGGDDGQGAVDTLIKVTALVLLVIVVLAVVERI